MFLHREAVLMHIYVQKWYHPLSITVDEQMGPFKLFWYTSAGSYNRSYQSRTPDRILWVSILPRIVPIASVGYKSYQNLQQIFFQKMVKVKAILIG